MKEMITPGGWFRERALTLLLSLMMFSSLMFVIDAGTNGTHSGTRGSFATHDAGNFTIIIDDDAGATGWNTLEFPSGEDRLASAYFGMGSASDKVDFGKQEEFQTIDPLSIASPGNFTDEEGYCSFSGWTGEDFENANITQRTFVNGYRENTRGHTGRWMVIDYLVEMGAPQESFVYFLQTMNVDLGSSPDDDLFTFLDDINTTVISDGSTFIGLGYLSTSESSPYFGHSAGAYGPGVYSGESGVWTHMSSPNNQDSTPDPKDWYMDISARVPSSSFTDPVHVSFVILVGSSTFDIREAYNDAVNAMIGEWTGPVMDDWSSGEVELEFAYDGPLFPPDEMMIVLSSREMEGDWGDEGIRIPAVIEGTRNVSLRVNTTGMVSDWGALEWYISSRSPFGPFDNDASGQFDVDNRGPDTNITYVNDDPTGILKISVPTDDRGGSGVELTYLSLDGEYYIEASGLEIYDERDDYSFYAYSRDRAGNDGPIVSLSNVINDGTPPRITSVWIDPPALDEDTEGPVNVTFHAVDNTSGLDASSGTIRWGIGSVTSPPVPVSCEGGNFTASIETDWYAAQGEELHVRFRVKDKLGNIAEMLKIYGIMPLQDPPDFVLTVISDEWEGNSVGLVLNGSDPDGDAVEFEFMYSLGEDIPAPIPGELLEMMDPYHFRFTLPDVHYEGAVNVFAVADDGHTPTRTNTAHFNMDRRAPLIGLVDLPEHPTITEPATVTITAEDGGSGVFSVWYVIEKGGDEKVEYSTSIVLEEEGIYNITVFTQDNVGNTRELSLDPITVDLYAPIVNITGPVEALRGKDLMITMRAADSMGFSPVKVNQDPSLFIDAWLVTEGGNVSVDSIVPSPEDGGLMTLIFRDPFTGEDSTFRVRIRVRDEAGNVRDEVFGPFDVGSIQEEPPFFLEFPERVKVGTSFPVNVSVPGSAVIEASYPGTTSSWMIYPGRTSGDSRSFELPGSFSPDDILFRVLYTLEAGDEPDLSFPSEGWLTVGIYGWSDRDGDMLCDAFERQYGLDPAVPDDTSTDADGDGLDLLMEMHNLTDPGSRDTDGDGMDDGWESGMGTLPFRDDAFEDPDGDTWSNIREHDAGTDPRDPASHPEELPVTPWYWIVLIILILLALIGYFAYQTVNRGKLKDDLENAGEEEEMSWDNESGEVNYNI